MAERLWVNAYANEVPAYIASARVIGEGGYEVDASMDSYDKPTSLDPASEDIIVGKVKEMLPKSFLQKRKLRADVKADFWRDMPVPPAPILSPREAIDSFRLPPGFRIETVAAEPLVEDPVTIAWDAAGRLWVVEMQGYMRTPEGADENEPISKVAVLEDMDGDGIMDRRTVFLDGLVMPRAIAMVAGGVLIGEPPRLWYCRDTDGDLVCDKKTLVSESYGQRDAVSRTSNGLLRGLDNWMVNARHPERFQFRDGRLITAPDAYRGDWGVAQDDFGRIYANVNSSWLHADLVPVRYLLRHPNLLSPAGVYERIVRNQEVHTIRLNTGVVAGHTVGMLRKDGRLAKTTAATSPTIYRGDRYPAEFYGNAFVPEPAGNVVGRFTLAEKDTGLVATHQLTPDQDWKQREFLASTDERFRPVHAATGPDGCLHIVDFYRGILEYKLFMNTYLREQIVERGLDRPAGLGRIYRIVHESKQPDQVPDLSDASAAKLVATLDHPNGWQRDTAQRLLVERGGKSAVNPLRTLATGARTPLGRLHALWTLEGIGAVDLETVSVATTDSHPKVRAAAIRVGESLGSNSTYQATLRKLGNDPDPGVQLQALLSLGEVREDRRALKTMADILVRNSENAHFRHAVISGVPGRELTFLDALLATPDFSKRPLGGRGLFLRELATVISSHRRPETTSALLARIVEMKPAEIQTSLLEGMLRASKKKRPLLLDRKPAALDELRTNKASGVVRAAAQVAKLITWPGDTTKAVAIEQARPLSKAEQAQFELGRKMYRGLCIACHQIHGRGMVSMAPSLVDSPWVLGSEERLINIVLHGLYGPLVIKGTEWNLVMPGQKNNPTLTDKNIAAILTYIRREWDHTADVVNAKSVAKVRAATSDRALPWTVRELQKIKP
ncbi:MAG: mono/diheme cytochrome c family protein [Limisphaerales bacterium]